MGFSEKLFIFLLIRQEVFQKRLDDWDAYYNRL